MTSTRISHATLASLDPDARDRWQQGARRQVDAECARSVWAGDNPGVIGTTRPESAGRVAEGIGATNSWTPARIEAWRDQRIDQISSWLLGPAQDWTVTAVADVALGLCDTRVRDVVLLDLITATQGARAEAGTRLWPVAETVPAAIRGPVGTVVAITEHTVGREARDLVAWAAEADPTYPLAGLLTAMIDSGVPVAHWLAAMSTLTRDECRARPAWANTAAERAGDPLDAEADPAAAATAGEDLAR